MSETHDPNSDLEKLRDLPIRAEEIGFAPEALLTCTKCGRSNSPIRADCIYCGTSLDGSTTDDKLDVHGLENWESGFNVVVVSSDVDELKPPAAILASVMGGKAEVFHSILESGKPVPVARLRSERHASLLTDKLAAYGVRATTVSDDSLAPNAPPVRLRGLEFGADELILQPFSGSGDIRIRSNAVVLIVAGLLCESKTESIEKRKRKATTTLSETITSSDETVIDVYPSSDRIGYRVPATGFDFSCLGPDKGLLAAENMERLIARLRDFAPDAKLVVDYPNVRSMLEHCWPSESRKDALGFQPAGFGRKGLSSVFTTNNSLQLLKYSRLRRNLL